MSNCSTDKNGTIKREIDALNRVIKYEDTFGNVIGYRYDPVGNLSVITYPDGTEVSYEYDVNNDHMYRQKPILTKM